MSHYQKIIILSKDEELFSVKIGLGKTGNCNTWVQKSSSLFNKS